jgi:hypothetical protein
MDWRELLNLITRADLVDFIAKLGVTGITIVGTIWAMGKVVGKKWVDLYFDKQLQTHKSSLDHYLETHKKSLEYQLEARKKSLDYYFNTQLETHKKSLEYQLETHKAEQGARAQQTVKMFEGVILAGLENVKAGHTENLEEKKLDLDKIRQIMAARIEALKAGLDLDSKTRLAISDRRLQPYKDLWKLMEPLSPRLSDELDRSALGPKFREWYYTNGNGLLLSWEATNAYVLATNLLSQEKAKEPDGTVRDAFSTLRTVMKVDLDVYSTDESTSQVGISK